MTIVGGATALSAGLGGSGGARPVEECRGAVEFSPAIESVWCNVEEDDCVCLAFADGGTWDVTATLGDLQKTVRVEVEEETCGPITEHVCFFGEC